MRKRILSTLLVGITLAAGALLTSSTSNAIDMYETRGHISLDLQNAVLVNSTTGEDRSGLVSDESGGYKLFFNNAFDDRRKIGITYRFADAYDMTDVEGLEFYGYSTNNLIHKFLYYVDKGSNTYYHTRPYDDVERALLEGNGYIWDTAGDLDAYDTYHRYSTEID